jgi:hypothetical protein
MNTLFIQFAYLQLLDLLTTSAFLIRGVKEANPFVEQAMHAMQSPVGGLLLVKGAAILLGLAAWRMRKIHLLTRINIAFALLIAWNLVALILAPGTAAA